MGCYQYLCNLSKRSTSQSNAVLGKHTVTSWTPSLRGCGITHPHFPRDPFFSRTDPAHPGYLLALAQLAHQHECPPDRSSSISAVEQSRCTSCMACVCWGHRAPWKHHRLCADPTRWAEQAAGSPHWLLWAYKEGWDGWMDGCWGMIDASG